MLIKICWFLSIPVLGVLLDSNATFSTMQIFFSISFLFYITIQLGIKKSIIAALAMGTMLDSYFSHPYLSNIIINLFIVLPIASLWLKHGDFKNIYLESLSLFLMSLIACIIKIIEADCYNIAQIDPYFTILYLFCSTLFSTIFGLITLSLLDQAAQKLHLTHFQTATIKRGI
jgi:hypothetical protein